MTNFDQIQLRRALASFATGVTVVTTMHDKTAPVGITVNSFTSVSLDPPLILWCLGNDTDSYDIFANCTHFAVHVLHQEQEEISQIFSTKNSSKFTDIDWETGEFGSPLLKDFASCFQCETETTYAGGDHIILLGRVKSIETQKKQPLVYHNSAYCRISDR
jgi:flavin reductase (DIM6/NTAB) family NADH-FMN oxidoreductase RutF